MKTLLPIGAIILILGGNALADPAVNQTVRSRRKIEEKTVFVTGSLIPKRVQLRPIGTTTVSPIRIIDRHEIDGTGRFTTQGALINEPAVRFVGH